MHDVALVRRLQGGEHRLRGPHRLLRRHRPVAPQALLERLAGHVLHGDVPRRSIGAAVVHGHDVGMAEQRRGLCLHAETFHELGVLRELGLQDLDGHEAAESRVLREIDVGHAAAAQTTLHAVAVRDGRGRLQYRIVGRVAAHGGAQAGATVCVGRPSLRRQLSVADRRAAVVPDVLQASGPHPRPPPQPVARSVRICRTSSSSFSNQTRPQTTHLSTSTACS